MHHVPIGRAGLAAMLPLILIGCSSSPSPTGTPTAAPTAQTTKTVTQSPAPTSTGGSRPTEAASVEPTPAAQDWTLTVGYSSDVSSLDPAIAYDVYSWPVVTSIFDSLVGYAADSTIVPRLAESMPTVSADGRTFTFTLREGVQFVDANGQPLREVTAEDVAYSLNRVLNPNLTPSPSPVAGTFFALIEGAEAVLSGEATEASGIAVIDDRTIAITLVEPNQAFLNIMAMPFAGVVPMESAGTDTAAFSNAPIGTGAYVLESWTPGDSVVLLRNAHYWDFDAGRAARIEVSIGVDADTQVQRVQTGQLDIAADLIPGGQYTAILNDPRYSDMVRLFGGPAINYLTMDTSGEGPTANVDVRRAINHAVDKDHYVALQNNRGQPAHCIFPTALPGHNPDCHPYDYDPDLARQILATAGYEDGFSTTIYTYDEPPGPEFAEALQQDLAAIGIQAELAVETFDTLLETIATPHNVEMIGIGWSQDFPDPSDFIDPLFSCAAADEGGTNTSWYCNEEVDQLATQARGEPDRQHRLELYQEVEQMIMEDAPIVPLNFPEQAFLISNRIDFDFHPIWQFDFSTPRLAPTS